MPRGRPRAPTFIVEQQRTAADLLALNINHWKLAGITSTPRECLSFLVEYHRIANTMICTVCHEPARLTAYQGSVDGLRWKCSDCNFVKSVRHGRFFWKGHLKMEQILDFIYFWAKDAPMIHATEEAEVYYDHTSIDRCNFMREVCVIWVDQNPPRLGGLDPVTMELIIVEVDETKYFHRKYARGQWHKGHWVFGGIERGNPHNGFLQEVPNRRAVTLNPILQQFVAQGIMVNTDQWAAYNGIAQLLEGYITIDHSVNFVDPDNPAAHTQGVESFWAHVKKKLKRMCVAVRQLLAEFEWRWRNDTYSSSGGLWEVFVGYHTAVCVVVLFLNNEWCCFG